MTDILRFLVEPTDYSGDSLEKFHLLFHIEDETVQLLKPTRGDFGLREGTLLGRQLVPYSPPHFKGHLNLWNITDSLSVEIIGRQFKLTGCDEATQDYLISHGLPAPPKVEMFSRPASLPVIIRNKNFVGRWPSDIRNFDQLDGRPLRFFGELTNEPKITGVTVFNADKIELLYYLQDNTMEVNLLPFSSLCDSSSKPRRRQILRRQRIKKDGGVIPLGFNERPALNLSSGLSVIRVLDRHPDAPPPPVVVLPQDLLLGFEVVLAGRTVKLCECDEVTSKYYKNVLGIEQKPIAYQYLGEKLGRMTIQKLPEAYKGKLEELPKDPLHPLPTSVSKNTIFAKKYRPEWDGVILRFIGQLNHSVSHSCEREFIFRVYLVDSTIAIYEKHKLNSGIKPGNFLGRTLICNQIGDDFVTPKDFCIGREIVLMEHHFYITGSDEFSMRFMERHPVDFPQANYEISRVLFQNILNSQELRSSLEASFKSFDKGEVGKITENVAVQILEQFCEPHGEEISKQNILTLVRHHQVTEPLPLSSNELSHLAALYLRRVNFTDVKALLPILRSNDLHKNGLLNWKQLLTFIKSAKWPLPKDILERLLERYSPQNEDINYEEFIREIDPFYRSNIYYKPPCELSEASFKQIIDKKVNLTKYEELMEAL